MKCSKCGKEIANDSVFCEYCGTKTRNDEQPIKTIDIRWALLPAMLIASIAAASILRMQDCRIWVYDQQLLCTTIPAVLFIIALFIITIWYGIKRLVPKSFVLIMGLFFISNCGLLLYDALDRHETLNAHMLVSWGNGGTCLELSNDILPLANTGYSVDHIDNKKKLLISSSQKICQKLKEEGVNDFEASEVWTYYYYQWGHIFEANCAMMFVLSLSLLYIIYAYWAPRKGWKF